MNEKEERHSFSFVEDYESFTAAQRKLLDQYVTNTSRHIFALRNLPEVMKGALFSRYSRSSLGLRSLLLKEFIGNDEEALFSSLTQGAANRSAESIDQQAEAIQKAQQFYDRILDGYGDDSIGELGGAHLALENVSMIAAKAIEDSRIGGSPLEKSSRYVYFDQKVHGKYPFYEEPVLMTSAYRDLYIATCNELFDTYSRLLPQVTHLFEGLYPKGEEISAAGYRAALRAKVLDALRGLLPAATLTNVGLFGNGRFFEKLLHRLHCHDLTELQDIGRGIQEELSKVIPSFVRRADPCHRTHQSYASFKAAMENDLSEVAALHQELVERQLLPGVRLVDRDPEGLVSVAAALLYPYGNKGLRELRDYCHKLSEEQIEQLLDAAVGARENRRHKSPRALEQANFTFEIIADYGAYRDLQRHRLLSQERQQLCCDYGFWTPQELQDSPFVDQYERAMWRAKEAFDAIAKELPKEAQYVVPNGYRIRWYMKANLRALQWLCELRSQPQGHPSYRWIAQEMARQVSDAVPSFERFFKFVDYTGYELGRLDAELRLHEAAPPPAFS